MRPRRSGIRCCPEICAGEVGPRIDKLLHSQRRSSHLPLPANDADIAFASVAQLSRWIETRQITSERLTTIYLDRLRTIRSQAALRDHADSRTCACSRPAAQTRRLQPENIAGHCTGFRGAQRICSTPPAFQPPMVPSPIGIGFQQKTAQSWQRLNAAGAVLVAKLSLGALGAERHLVWRTDDESVAPGRRRIRIECRARRRDSRGAGWRSQSAAKLAAAS